MTWSIIHSISIWHLETSTNEIVPEIQTFWKICTWSYVFAKSRPFRKGLNVLTIQRRLAEIASFWPSAWIDQFHKSQKDPVPYPTMLLLEQKCAHFCSEWSIVGYGTGAFWDCWSRSILSPPSCMALGPRRHFITTQPNYNTRLAHFYFNMTVSLWCICY